MPTSEPRPASRRAALLADRIEEGAAKLAAFIKELPEAHWKKPISATDRRTVGVVVHHVAFVYPIEIEVARAIASGKAVETSWPDIVKLNAGHAGDNADITKAAALEALAKNSREAADAVRTFTDEELDRSAPFGLSYGAPVTAQFVIEDHALRHAWHHLAKIRESVGRS
jgi:DinB family protein